MSTPSSWKRCNLYKSYLNILLDTIQPRAVLTGADNNSALAEIANNRKDILFIFVQSSLRDVNSFPYIHRLPVYCSFGDVEQKIFNDLDIYCDVYLPLGSVKYGIAQNHKDSHIHPLADIAFISSYRADHVVNSRHSTLINSIHGLDKLLFKHTIEYASKNNKSVRVLAKSREKVWQRKEYIFYKELAKSYPFDFFCGDKLSNEFSSYNGLNPSTIIIHTGSTLGFEALASGARVLFGATTDPELIHLWGVHHYFQQLPKLVCLETRSFKHFSSKLDTIINLSAHHYRAAIETKSRLIVRHRSPKYPHGEIKDILSKLFEGSMSNRDLYATLKVISDN